MKTLTRLLVVCLLLGGCKMSCDDPASPATKLSGALASQWGCDQKAVQADLDAWFASKGLCDASSKQNMQGPLGNLVCPFFISQLQKFAANQIPANWKCDQSKIGAKLFDAAQALCVSVVPI